MFLPGCGLALDELRFDGEAIGMWFSSCVFACWVDLLLDGIDRELSHLSERQIDGGQALGPLFGANQCTRADDGQVVGDGA